MIMMVLQVAAMISNIYERDVKRTYHAKAGMSLIYQDRELEDE